MDRGGWWLQFMQSVAESDTTEPLRLHCHHPLCFLLFSLKVVQLIFILSLLLLFSPEVVSHSLSPYGLQHTRFPYSSLIESVMLSNHLILCSSLLLLLSIFPSIRVFSNESCQVAKVLEFQLQHQSFQ